MRITYVFRVVTANRPFVLNDVQIPGKKYEYYLHKKEQISIFLHIYISLFCKIIVHILSFIPNSE